MKVIAFVGVHGRTVYINPEHISTVERYGNGQTRIVLMGGKDAWVLETPEEIAICLNKDQK